ncbi:Transposon Ty3-G Gag-Pol polyprotein [Cucumis melo var. makuwa]|uniref:Transposon Ty3-G Gag-Pol polyprotein n=1 Tax=Cucumis melo var. makuwa TaxID=1194695 RepID=A0A5A7V5L4_CUCMM|nr:Transposon Ty3-G Gag-Pol polyprotein [Cucumis melo var. makuwa]
MPILKEECYNLNSMIGFLPKAKTLPRVLTTLSHCCTHPKLALRFVRSFQVVERVGPVAYLLALPKGAYSLPEDATWEKVDVIQALYPNFHLEDKVDLWGRVMIRSQIERICYTSVTYMVDASSLDTRLNCEKKICSQTITEVSTGYPYMLLLVKALQIKRTLRSQQ